MSCPQTPPHRHPAGDATSSGAAPTSAAAATGDWSERWTRPSRSQVRAEITAVGRVNRAGRDRIDDLVGELALDDVGFGADHLEWEVDILVDELLAGREQRRRRSPGANNRLIPTPRLDGSGSFSIEYDDLHFPLLSQASDNQADDHRHPFETASDLPGPDDACDPQ